MEAADEPSDPKRSSLLRSRLIGFVMLSVGAVVILRLWGAPPLLILEVFGLAVILGISAVLVVLVLYRSPRIRYMHSRKRH